MTIIEERTVGPSLGADRSPLERSRRWIAAALVLGFMIFAYGTAWHHRQHRADRQHQLDHSRSCRGLGRTLTLHRHRGQFVLTMGMAVDSNNHHLRAACARSGRKPPPPVPGTVARCRFPQLQFHDRGCERDGPLSSPRSCIYPSVPARSAALGVTLAIGIITTVSPPFLVTRWMTPSELRAAGKPKGSAARNGAVHPRVTSIRSCGHVRVVLFLAFLAVLAIVPVLHHEHGISDDFRGPVDVGSSGGDQAKPTLAMCVPPDGS